MAIGSPSMRPCRIVVESRHRGDIPLAISSQRVGDMAAMAGCLMKQHEGMSVQVPDASRAMVRTGPAIL